MSTQYETSILLLTGLRSRRHFFPLRIEKNMAAVLDEVGKSEEKLKDDTQNGEVIEDLEVENGAEEASKKKKRKKKKKKAGTLNF